MSLVKIDLAKLVAKDSKELIKLKNAMVTIGFFKLVNYGMSGEKCKKFEDKTKEFFGTSDETKNKIKLKYASDEPFRGYYGAGIECLGFETI